MSATILPLNRSNSGISAGAELNTFFPFDPYRLPRSAAFIKNIYREWSSVAIDDESDDESDDGDGEKDLDELEVSNLSPPEKEGSLAIPKKRYKETNVSSRHDIAVGLGESLEQISISPKILGAMASTSVVSVTMGSVV